MILGVRSLASELGAASPPLSGSCGCESGATRQHLSPLEPSHPLPHQAHLPFSISRGLFARVQSCPVEVLFVPSNAIDQSLSPVARGGPVLLQCGL